MALDGDILQGARRTGGKCFFGVELLGGLPSFTTRKTPRGRTAGNSFAMTIFVLLLQPPWRKRWECTNQSHGSIPDGDSGWSQGGSE